MKTPPAKQQKEEWKKYLAEIEACTCLTPERKDYIRSGMAFAKDFPDGAFMAYMDECGIDVTELECFSTTHYAENHCFRVCGIRVRN